ncbi:hypothetical protein SPB21_08775 [Leptothoe sp. ISB3NOV94-8A]
MNILSLLVALLAILLVVDIVVYLLTPRTHGSSSLMRFGVVGLLKSLREVPTFLLMRLAFGGGLCRFGVFRAVRADSLDLGERPLSDNGQKMVVASQALLALNWYPSSATPQQGNSET